MQSKKEIVLKQVTQLQEFYFLSSQLEWIYFDTDHLQDDGFITSDHSPMANISPSATEKAGKGIIRNYAPVLPMYPTKAGQIQSILALS